jgi:transposase-like protein
MICKYCSSNDITKYGTYKGQQRYFCKSCRRKFKEDNCTYHMKISSDVVNIALDMYYQGFLISEIRKFIKQKYGTQLSLSIVYKWIEKYRNLAIERFQDCHPEVENVWAVNEMNVELDARHHVWVYDIRDTETKVLLSSRISMSPDLNQIGEIVNEAILRAGKNPELLIVHAVSSSNQAIIEYIRKNITFVRRYHVDDEYDDELLSRLRGFVNGAAVIHEFKYVRLFQFFTVGWGINYNFFKRQSVLNGKTPAEMANIKYDIKTWADLTPNKLLCT